MRSFLKMNKSLLLKSSCIFDDSNLIDQIRQTYIDVINCKNEEDIHEFLNESFLYLEKDLSNDIALELFSAIFHCFINYSTKLTPEFGIFLEKSRMNANYIIITIYLIYYFKNNQPELLNSECQSFVDDGLKDILLQIDNLNEKPLTIFGHKIPLLFNYEVITSFVLSSNLTKNLFSKLFPYIIIQNISCKNPKSDLFFKNVLKSDFITILPQDEISDQQISEFITSKNINLLSTMNENALSLIESVVIFIKNEEKNTIKGITKETILPFIAILMILLEKSQQKLPLNIEYEDLIIESIKSLANNKSLASNASIDLILSYQFKFIKKDIYQYYFILTRQLINNQYNANKMLLLKNIFILTSNDNFDILSVFFNEFGLELFNCILKNIEEINKNEELKQTKMNLMFANTTMIINLLINCFETKDVINLIYFFENLCYNQPVIANSPQISDILLKTIHEKIKEENWNDVLLIGEFMKKNDFIDDLLGLLEFSFPIEIKNCLFNFIPNDENDEVDDLLSSILSDSNIEYDDTKMKSLIDLMLKDKEIFHAYVTYLLCSYEITAFSIEKILILHRKEFELDKDEFVNAINRVFYYNQTERNFIQKEGFFLSTLPVSAFGQSIIKKLFKLAESKAGNYEAFICLKHISSTFPFLFNNLFDKTIEVVCKEIKNLHLIFENNETETHLRTIKTSYAALSFFSSIFQSSYFLDQFIEWFLINALNLDDSQVLGFLIILNWISPNGLSCSVYLYPIIKFNALEIFGKLLDRNVEKGLFMNCYKSNIFDFVLKIYQKLKVSNIYEILQLEEFCKKIEKPLTYIYDYGFTGITCKYVPQYQKFNGVSDKFANFAENINRVRDFWIVKEKNLIEIKPEDTVELYEKLEKFDSFTNFSELPSIPSIITVKMARYLIMKKTYIYSWILYKKSFSFVNEQKELLINTINDLNEIQKNTNNEDDYENFDVSCLEPSDLALSNYCQEELFKNLVKELTIQSKPTDLLINLISVITENQISLFAFLEFISQYFANLYTENSIYDITTSTNSMINLIDILISLSKKDGFKENFVDLCGNNILNIIMKPKLRTNRSLLTKTAELFALLEVNLPIRTTQLICFMLLLEKPDLPLIFKLIKKFDYSQLNNVYHSVYNIFNTEMQKMELSNIFIEFIKIFPSIIEDNKETLFSLLENMLQKYLTLNENNDNNKLLNDISSLFNILAPKKTDLINLKTFDEKLTTIPSKIKETSQPFWNLFEKYSGKIIELIENQPFLLDKFKFLADYPELTSFKVRSSFFRTKMRKRMNHYSRFVLHVDRKNILTTSFKGFFNKSNEQLLRRFDVVFNGEQSIDEGGPTRDWFTTLSKEIFNQNYGLFECSKNTKCYQPSSLSNINPNHIEYFKFAGKYVARSLIEGQCIDAHFTTSFLKQILKCELNLKDIEDIDDELYKNLDWMLNNDVDSLYMFFEIDTKELGEIKSIELKENGSEIKVTNENKTEYVYLRTNYALKEPIEQQVNAFCEGFYSLIDYDDIKIFSPKELDLLICGVPEINVKDFIENTSIEYPYDNNSPVIKFFFEAISKWENEKLAKLLLFMTGSSRVPSNGFKEFCEMTGSPLKISSGGDKNRIPQSHTCFNTICLPKYESEEELNEKLILAIEECNTFEMA